MKGVSISKFCFLTETSYNIIGKTYLGNTKGKVFYFGSFRPVCLARVGVSRNEGPCEVPLAFTIMHRSWEFSFNGHRSGYKSAISFE